MDEHQVPTSFVLPGRAAGRRRSRSTLDWGCPRDSLRQGRCSRSTQLPDRFREVWNYRRQCRVPRVSLHPLKLERSHPSRSCLRLAPHCRRSRSFILALGFPIATGTSPFADGTGGFYLAEDGDSEKDLLLTARQSSFCRARGRMRTTSTREMTRNVATSSYMVPRHLEGPLNLSGLESNGTAL